MRVEVKVVGRIKVSRDDRVVLEGANLVGEDYSGRDLMQFCTIGCRLERCRFNRARIRDTQFGSGRAMSEFIECSFDGATMIHGGSLTRFVRCSFRDVDLRDWMCHAVEMVDCVFTGRMTRCIFNGTVPVEQRPLVGRERNEFHGNDFSGVDLVDVAFRSGIDLTQQRLPTGPEYLYLPDAAEVVRKARAEAATWSESDLRERALRLLKMWEEVELRGGQRQLFLRSDDYYPIPPREAVDKLFALLRTYTAGAETKAPPEGS